MFLILALVLFLTIILSTLSTIPVIVAVFLCFTVAFKNPWIFLAALLGGLLIDLFMLRTPGSTSLFLVAFTLMIFLYQRRFEIQTIPFVFLACVIGSIVYLTVFGYNQILIQALANSVVAVLFFKFLIRNLKFEMKSKFEN